jgi:Spy/CpxP family protein refolding chaperone
MKKSGRMTAVVSILVVALTLVGGSVLYAHLGSHGKRGGMNPEERIESIQKHLTPKLALDADQQKEFEAMARDLLEKGKALHQLRETAREEMVGILREETLDRDRIEKLAASHRDQISGFITEASGQLTDFASTLSPEQRQKLADVIEEHHGRWHCPSRSGNDF